MARKRPLESGWCQTANHPRCPHLMQEANPKRPELWCACKCHVEPRRIPLGG